MPGVISISSLFFFFNDTATTEIYTLSLHDALPIYCDLHSIVLAVQPDGLRTLRPLRSEEHTSELQSLAYLVCRLLLEKKNIQHSGVQPVTEKAPHHRAQLGVAVQ